MVFEVYEMKGGNYKLTASEIVGLHSLVREAKMNTNATSLQLLRSAIQIIELTLAAFAKSDLKSSVGLLMKW